MELRSGAKPPSSPTAVASPRSCSVRLRAWKTSAPMRRHSEKRRRAARHDHELLEVDLVVGVGAAVEHVHHRHRQHPGGLPAEVAPQRKALLGGLRMGGGQRDAQDRVGAEARLVGGAVELDQRGRGPPGRRRPCRRAPRRSRRRRSPPRAHALALPALAAVAQLGGLELARRRARGHRGVAVSAGAQADLDLDRRVAPAVEDLAGVDSLDLAHRQGLRLARRRRRRWGCLRQPRWAAHCPPARRLGAAGVVVEPLVVLGALYCLQSVTT